VGSVLNASIYSGTKAAILMISKSIAREVAGDGILVNCVAPGPIKTDIQRNLPADRLKAACDQIPLKRFGEPEEVAASDRRIPQGMGKVHCPRFPRRSHSDQSSARGARD